MACQREKGEINAHSVPAFVPEQQSPAAFSNQQSWKITHDVPFFVQRKLLSINCHRACSCRIAEGGETLDLGGSSRQSLNEGGLTLEYFNACRFAPHLVQPSTALKPMSNFSYEAVDSGGLKIEGSLEVIDQNEAIRRVKEMGLFPVRIVEARKPRKAANVESRGPKGRSGALKVEIKVPFLGTRVKGSVLAVFTRQLSTLIEAGMPLLRGLRILREQEESPALRKMLDSISDQIEGGGSLSEALAAHPKVFNGLYINMVKAGELSGALEITLRRLADFMEKAQKIRGKVKAAMFYPVSVMVVATGILTLLMVYIIPKFREVFDGFGIPLPAFTQFVLGLSNAIRGHIFWILGGVGLFWLALWFTGRTVSGRRFFDHLKLSMPVFGPVFKKLAISRFARTLGTLLGNGVPILQALNIVKETTGNVIVSRVVSNVHDSVKEGETIALPLKASGVFPAMVAGMVDIGEQTGALPDMLMKVADNYDDQVDNAVVSMTSLLEPIMLVFLAVIVGGIVLAMFWPIIKLIDGDGIQGGHGEE
jgi:type IV pilus assembly protein PilC